jgi:Tol biopolymer transport system component
MLMRVDVVTGTQSVITDLGTSAGFRPVYSRDGSRIYFIGMSKAPVQPDVYVVSAAGGIARPVQVTNKTFETSVDVR